LARANHAAGPGARATAPPAPPATPSPGLYPPFRLSQSPVTGQDPRLSPAVAAIPLDATRCRTSTPPSGGSCRPSLRTAAGIPSALTPLAPALLAAKAESLSDLPPPGRGPRETETPAHSAPAFACSCSPAPSPP